MSIESNETIVAEQESSPLDSTVDSGVSGEDSIYDGKNYKVSTTANDFNVSTIFSYFKAGTFEIPPFQRNYVWDIRKASKLIESLILGLPIPQVFLWQKERSKLAIIDGQQRLTSIYFFLSGRFPKINKVAELRKIMDGNAKLADTILQDDAYFTDFKLTFSRGYESPYAGQKYTTLDEDVKGELDLRPLRSITVKQEDPKNNDSMYEIFNRLNTGGINLKPQEIRMSLNHSSFFEMLWTLNENEIWRKLLKTNDFDKHAQDVELLTRAFAMLLYSERYSSNSMIQFLNHFSEAINPKTNQNLLDARKMSKTYSDDTLKEMFVGFLTHCNKIGLESFSENGKFIFPLFESCFYAAFIRKASEDDNAGMVEFTADQVRQILNTPEFVDSRKKATNNTTNVKARLDAAKKIIF